MNQQKLFPLFFSLLLFSTSTLSAQTDRTDRREEHPEHPEHPEKEPSPFFSRLWYGGGFGIGFSGYNGASQFSIGISPMVGYKIYGPFSIGPRVSVTYNSIKFSGLKAFNLFDTEAGIFLRAKVFRGFFLQGELAEAWGNDIGPDQNGYPVKIPNEYSNQYIGAGYNFGDGEVGSEIGIYYNVAAANNLYSTQPVWQPRFGFTWKF